MGINFERQLGHGFSADEPNDVLGDETCVRMRGGMYNDALCGDSNGFNKNEMQVRQQFSIRSYPILPKPKPNPKQLGWQN